jgi:hypothetical protein
MDVMGMSGRMPGKHKARGPSRGVPYGRRLHTRAADIERRRRPGTWGVMQVDLNSICSGLWAAVDSRQDTKYERPSVHVVKRDSEALASGAVLPQRFGLSTDAECPFYYIYFFVPP